MEEDEEEDDIILVQHSGSYSNASSDHSGYESFGFLEGEDEDASPCMSSRLTSTSSIFASSTFSSLMVGDPILQSLSNLQTGFRSHLQSWQDTWDRLSFEERIRNLSETQTNKTSGNIFRPAVAAVVAPCLKPTTCSSIGRHVKRSFFSATGPRTTSTTMMAKEHGQARYDVGRIQVELVPLRPTKPEEDADVALECTWVGHGHDYMTAAAADNTIPPPFPLQRV